jgi:hypothetical protein
MESIGGATVVFTQSRHVLAIWSCGFDLDVADAVTAQYDRRENQESYA